MTLLPERMAVRLWGEELREDRQAHRKMLRRCRLTGLTLGIFFGSILLPPVPRLVWNRSASAPIGLYFIAPNEAVRTGDMVAARVPQSVASLAAERRYIPLGVPLIKRIAAMPGDDVCAAGDRISISGAVVAFRRERDAQARLLPRWFGCRRLHEDDVFLLMADVPTSFDGRYFGVTSRSVVIGKARLLWRR